MGSAKVMEEEMSNPIDKDKTTDLPGLLEYAHHLGSAVIKPEDQGKIKGRALKAMEEQTEQQMAQIYDQIKLLADQAKKIKDRVEVSTRIYQAQMRFSPIVGRHYYMYEDKNGRDILTLVSPEEWGKSMPYKSFTAEVKLLADHTWELIRNPGL